ncbi:MFS transporter, FHS family, L-fucose permease [Catalinimonas alkaloidigena]|uniref:MFS transporter, FHS family, L-fucose permease n=1 Tax=Catalinimonas alkaloidigena TaxID=1075417 RepID=A0A1G9GM68_9BACT|nr:L-fucose:H+ symporter permease [Catalinimonas alkaloidigena]SDL01702.1 MFS transporter, FHS family, L-fucose permease [Catalinimonas alkaloidigena]
MNSSRTSTPLLPFVLITSLFLMWGLANNMTDTLLAAFKRIMSMSDFQTAWIQVAFYGSYFCLALPAALLIKRYTYKTGVLVGLGLFIAGSLLFYPASQTMVYGHFLTALFILAGGLSILETTANPYIIAMGPEESGTRRLNLAQSFNPIGSVIGVLLSKFFILSQLDRSDALARASMTPEQLNAIQAKELAAVMGPYVGVAVVLLALWAVIAFTKMPKATDETHVLDFGATIRRLLKNSNYVWAVVAQFFYVGAQICVWSFTIRYVMQELGVDEDAAANYYLAALLLFIVSRFICTALMKFFSPGAMLMSLAILAMVCTGMVILFSGLVSVIALVMISGCMSLMFPTIYGLGLQGLGTDTKIGGSGLIMAILGGALLPLVQGQVSDMAGSISVAFIIPLICFGLVAYYGSRTRRQQPVPTAYAEAEKY